MSPILWTVVAIVALTGLSAMLWMGCVYWYRDARRWEARSRFWEDVARAQAGYPPKAAGGSVRQAPPAIPSGYYWSKTTVTEVTHPEPDPWAGLKAEIERL